MATLEELLATANAGKLNNTELYGRLTDDTSLTSDELAGAAQCIDWYVRYLTAGHPNVSAQTLVWLSKDPIESVRMSAVAADLVPSAVLMELSTDPDDGVRQGVAGHHATPREVLSNLAEDLEPDVRWCVAGNPNTPIETLMELAYDLIYDVQEAVAANPSTPPMMKLWLTSDYKQKYDTRRILGINPNRGNTMKCEIGDEVEVARFGQKVTGRVTGVFVYPSGTSDYSIGCATIQPFWIHESYIKLVKAV